MCGIAGFCNFEQDYQKKCGYWDKVLLDMRKAIAHRGADDSGAFMRKHIGLSHTRLAIRDINNGVQPIYRKIDGNEYAICYNGEIYNTTELKSTLSNLGYEFSTTTDTEVILYTYIQYGPRFVEKLNGIFSFAIWDETKQSLFLYRDRVGIKPLFYSFTEDNTLIFGSEIKALFKYPDFKPAVDIEGLREIFGIGPARTAGNGVFKNVSEVKPGHYILFTENKQLYDITYWDLIPREHEDSYEDTVDTVKYLVTDAIERQMVSDVPVCSFLSGGIDSSIVTAVAQGFMEKKGKTLNTFSFDYNDNDIFFKSNAFQPERDKPYVDIMVEAYKTNHTYLECTQSQLFDNLYASVIAKDLPNMADVESSLLYFCREVKKYNKVALTGECADEIFGGYPWFYREELFNVDGFPWSNDMNARCVMLQDGFINDLNLDEYVREKYQSSISNVIHMDNESEIEYKRRNIAYLNIKWFMQTLLDRMDRTSMYSGLEARVPFADHRIIEYLYSVPWDMKYRNGVEKWLLREAMQNVLPNELLMRKKSPYPKTYNPEYERLLANRLKEIINNPNSRIKPILDKDKVEKFIEKPAEYGKPWFGQLMAAPQMMAYIIQVDFWLEKYGISL